MTPENRAEAASVPDQRAERNDREKIKTAYCAVCKRLIEQRGGGAWYHDEPLPLTIIGHMAKPKEGTIWNDPEIPVEPKSTGVECARGGGFIIPRDSDAFPPAARESISGRANEAKKTEASVMPMSRQVHAFREVSAMGRWRVRFEYCSGETLRIVLIERETHETVIEHAATIAVEDFPALAAVIVKPELPHELDALDEALREEPPGEGWEPVELWNLVWVAVAAVALVATCVWIWLRNFH